MIDPSPGGGRRVRSGSLHYPPAVAASRSPSDLTRSDRPVALVVAFGFALSLGIGTVAVPLVALGAGYAPASIGF